MAATPRSGLDIYRRLGGESNWEIVSCRARVRAQSGIPSEIQARNRESAATFPFPFVPTGLSLFTGGIEWNKVKSNDIK